MRNISIALTVAAAVLIGGCATKGSNNSGQATSVTPAATSAATVAPPRIATPVSVPAVSARKVVMSMTGSKQVVEAKDWADFKREWRDTFSEYAKPAGIAFTFVDGPVQPAAEDGTVLTVDVADYRMVGIGARIFLGIMTGNAYIDSKVKFSNLRDGSSFGEQQYNTTSSAWGGVFAKVTPQQVDQIGGQVFREFKATK